jgi:exonuclease SbcC
MIPVYLQISGIYSYRNSQEIDFGKLTAAHLFGIFGAVGSGKSALLEAIIYVLYGETERLNNREQRAYNMMNLRSNDAFIRFDFLSPDQMLYRAVAKGKRNSKNKEDVKFERALYRVEGNDLVPVDVGGIESIIGISYDNFRRTIIIPQGGSRNSCNWEPGIAPTWSRSCSDFNVTTWLQKPEAFKKE